MGTLPRSLEPWSSELSPLRTELLPALGPWLPRLDALLGPMRRREQAGFVSVEGVSGLSRQGSYERLLLSEWALAEAAPDEFLRRAASAEHLFVDLQRREPAGSRRCIVLLDAGPEQLGAPRIAHLAILIVLARRASAAQAQLMWGLVHRSAHPPWENLDRIALEHLLKHRTLKAPTEADLRRWVDHLAVPQDGDEVWVVGGSTLTSAAPTATHTLAVADAPHQEGALTVLFNRGRRLQLPLPSPDAQRRLLTDPLRPPPPTPTPSAMISEINSALRPFLRFSASGARLLVLQADAAVIAIRLPKTPGLTPRIDRYPIPKGHRLVGLGWYRAPLLMMLAPSGDLVIEMARHGQQTLPAASLEGLQFNTAAPVECHRVASGSSGSVAVRFIDGAGRLIEYDLAHGQLHCMTETAWLLANPDGRSMILGLKNGRTALTLEYPDSGVQEEQIFEEAHLPRSARLGSLKRGSPFHNVAIEWDQQRWTSMGKEPLRVQLTGEQTVFGVCPFPERFRRPGLLVRSTDRLSLALVREDESFLLPTNSGLIRTAAVSPGPLHVAWLTDGGELVVYSLHQDKPLCTIQTSGLSPAS